MHCALGFKINQMDSVKEIIRLGETPKRTGGCGWGFRRSPGLSRVNSSHVCELNFVRKGLKMTSLQLEIERRCELGAVALWYRTALRCRSHGKWN